MQLNCLVVHIHLHSNNIKIYKKDSNTIIIPAKFLDGGLGKLDPGHSDQMITDFSPLVLISEWCRQLQHERMPC